MLSQQWAEFHSHYQSFSQWLRNMDTDMANLNPFVSNMATVQLQLVKLKVCNVIFFILFIFFFVYNPPHPPFSMSRFTFFFYSTSFCMHVSLSPLSLPHISLSHTHTHPLSHSLSLSQEIQEELKGHEGVLDALKLFSYKLHQEEGSSCHVNPAAIRSRLENASRRWDHLKRLAQER